MILMSSIDAVLRVISRCSRVLLCTLWTWLVWRLLQSILRVFLDSVVVLTDIQCRGSSFFSTGGFPASQNILYPTRWATRSLALGSIPIVSGSESWRTWLDSELMYLNGVFSWEVDFHCGDVCLVT